MMCDSETTRHGEQTDCVTTPLPCASPLGDDLGRNVDLPVPTGKVTITATESPCTRGSRLVNGPRQKKYGHPLDNWDRIALMWSIILNHPVTRNEAIDMMIALKLCRNVNVFDPDNRDDSAGYAEVGFIADEEEKLRPSTITVLLDRLANQGT